MNKPNQDFPKIEHGIPVVTIGRIGKWGDVLKLMKPGDSIHIEHVNHPPCINACFYIKKKFPGMKFTVRKYNGAYRCWRIK